MLSGMDVAHLLIAVSIAIIFCEAQAAELRSSNFTRRPDHNDTVTYNVIRALQTRSLTRCSAACVTQNFCRHFRFCKDTGNCVLSDATIMTTPYNHIVDDGCSDFDREVCTRLFHTFGYRSYQYPFHDFEGEFVADFGVKTSQDAILSLSRSTDNYDDVQYEIVIGGNGNSKTLLRRCSNCAEMASVQTVSIVSESEMRRFWFRYDRGRFLLGRYRERAFFDFYEAPGNVTIRYFGIGSWGQTNIWLLYVNCA